MYKATVIGLVITLVAAVFAIGGCSSDRITARSVRRNMSPELQSIAAQREQRKNMYARTRDTNLRQIWDDFDHVMLREHPVRLSEYPIP